MRCMHDLLTQEITIPDGYDLKLSEMQELLLRVRLGNKEDAAKAIYDCFRYGFLCGHRATKRKKVVTQL